MDEFVTAREAQIIPNLPTSGKVSKRKGEREEREAKRNRETVNGILPKYHLGCWLL